MVELTAVALQIIGVFVALASLEWTLLGKNFPAVRKAYLVAYRRSLRARAELEKSNLVVPGMKALPWMFRYKGTRRVLFGIALNPRRRFLTVFGYLFILTFELLPVISVTGIVLLSGFSSWPNWVIFAFLVLWLIGFGSAVYGNWQIGRGETKRSGAAFAWLAVYRSVKAWGQRCVSYLWNIALIVVDSLGMLPAMFLPARALPLTETNQRQRYFMQVGALYIVSGLLLGLVE